MPAKVKKKAQRKPRNGLLTVLTECNHRIAYVEHKTERNGERRLEFETFQPDGATADSFTFHDEQIDQLRDFLNKFL